MVIEIENRHEAQMILDALPCSVELPAGTGKTELIARMAACLADRGKRVLILTHTHAGVDALRQRLRIKGVPKRAAAVGTLDSWCFRIISSYPILAAIDVGKEPDWKLSAHYHLAGSRAVIKSPLVKMLAVSYDALIVDEYQDCQLHQHNLIKAVAETLPTCVLGDRMQGLFFFGELMAVNWVHDVEPTFPRLNVPVVPWRWNNSNPDLGGWLLKTRNLLLAGREISLADAPVALFGAGQEIAACQAILGESGTSLAICRWPKSAARLAQRLGGTYTMIEELEGRYLREFSILVDQNDGPDLARATADFATGAAFGVANAISMEHRKMLARGKAIPPLTEAHVALNSLLINPSITSVKAALLAISNLPNFRLYRREAWYGMRDALRLASTSDLTVHEAVVQVRNRLSYLGRQPEKRIVGRPLLVKGLEFDHAVLVEPQGMNAHELYVSLSRGSNSMSIVTDDIALQATRPSGS